VAVPLFKKVWPNFGYVNKICKIKKEEEASSFYIFGYLLELHDTEI
jgi:hypothetical protein